MNRNKKQILFWLPSLSIVGIIGILILMNHPKDYNEFLNIFNTKFYITFIYIYPILIIYCSLRPILLKKNTLIKEKLELKHGRKKYYNLEYQEIVRYIAFASFFSMFLIWIIAIIILICNHNWSNEMLIKFLEVFSLYFCFSLFLINISFCFYQKDKNIIWVIMKVYFILFLFSLIVGFLPNLTPFFPKLVNQFYYLNFFLMLVDLALSFLFLIIKNRRKKEIFKINHINIEKHLSGIIGIELTEESQNVFINSILNEESETEILYNDKTLYSLGKEQKISLLGSDKWIDSLSMKENLSLVNNMNLENYQTMFSNNWNELTKDWSLTNQKKLAILITLLEEKEVYILKDPWKNLDTDDVIEFEKWLEFRKYQNKVILILSTNINNHRIDYKYRYKGNLNIRLEQINN